MPDGVLLCLDGDGVFRAGYGSCRVKVSEAELMQ
jgi:hypothetical protein